MKIVQNEWISEIERLRAENDNLRENLFCIRVGWFFYGILAGLGLAAIMYAGWGG